MAINTAKPENEREKQHEKKLWPEDAQVKQQCVFGMEREENGWNQNGKKNQQRRQRRLQQEEHIPNELQINLLFSFVFVQLILMTVERLFSPFGCFELISVVP